MKKQIFWFALAALVMMARPAPATCLMELTGGYTRQFSRTPHNQEFLGLRGYCLWFGTGLYFDRVNGHNGFTLEESFFLPLDIGHPGRDPEPPVLFYLDPGVGYRVGGGGMNGFSFVGGGLMWPIHRSHDIWGTDVYGMVEVRQRFRFGSPFNAGTQLSFGIVLVGPD